LSDEGPDALPEQYPGITPTQRAQMQSGLEAVRASLGDIPGITDREIRESLWEYYFDVEQTVPWLLQQHEEKIKAEKEKQKKKGKCKSASLHTLFSNTSYVFSPPFLRNYSITSIEHALG
jgi:hypothetical protein